MERPPQRPIVAGESQEACPCISQSGRAPVPPLRSDQTLPVAMRNLGRWIGEDRFGGFFCLRCGLASRALQLQAASALPLGDNRFVMPQYASMPEICCLGPSWEKDYISGMAKSMQSQPVTTTTVRDARTGKLVTVKGVGALKGSSFSIREGFDLTKPIASQALRDASGRKLG